MSDNEAKGEQTVAEAKQALQSLAIFKWLGVAMCFLLLLNLVVMGFEILTRDSTGNVSSSSEGQTNNVNLHLLDEKQREIELMRKGAPGYEALTTSQVADLENYARSTVTDRINKEEGYYLSRKGDEWPAWKEGRFWLIENPHAEKK